MSQSNDLVDFMNSATKQMEEEYVRIQKRATEDPGTAGDQGEENWATLLRSWLPPTFQIVTKGRILSSMGIASPQVDVIVLRPEYPKQLLDKKLYLAGGVLAAFECKLTLKSEHIPKFFLNSIAIKSSIEVRYGTPYKELHCPIIYGLLAHSHSWKRKKSTPIENIENNLIDTDSLLIKHPLNMPDVFCVADLGCWSSHKMVFFGPSQVPDWTSLAAIHGENGSARTAYVGHTIKMENQAETFTPIGSLINSLLHKLAMEHKALRQLARYFTMSSIGGSGQGQMRPWDSSIYSDKIRRNVEQGRLVSGEPWNEWSVAFT